MADFKYVDIRVNDMYDFPFIFPDKVCHDTMADSAIMAITIDLQQSGSKHWKTEVISAGFINIQGNITKHGSETMNIKLNKVQAEKDQYLIDVYPYMHGIVI